jgi:hypothetical protein
MLEIGMKMQSRQNRELAACPSRGILLVASWILKASGAAIRHDEIYGS